jgi:alpha-N-arabinofuranosidase
LKIRGNGAAYSFYASFDDSKTWLAVAVDADAKNLSTEVAGGFTGTILGLYTSSANK